MMLEPQRFAALVLADVALTARLAAFDDGAGFVAEVVRTARAHDVVLPEACTQPTHAGLTSLCQWIGPPLVRSSPPPGWFPSGVTDDSGAIDIDWARFGPQRLHALFDDNDARRAVHLPFNRVFRYRTGLQGLIGRAETADSLTPSGLIFHMSRCGSTLAAQMLAALSDSIVFSELESIDGIVRLGRRLPEADAVRALRAIVTAFGRSGGGRERRFFVKLDCWHTLALPLFRRAFPDVPWVFLYRNPVEVLVSQMHQRGMQMVPQFLPPSFYGIDWAERINDEDYCARVLGVICRAAIDHHGSGCGLILNYRQLPQGIWTAVPQHFGILCSEAERLDMQRAAQRDAKSPTVPFVGDTEAKQRAATANVRHAAERHLGAIYDRLEALSANLTPDGTPALSNRA
jgi:hypothetical protein